MIFSMKYHYIFSAKWEHLRGTYLEFDWDVFSRSRPWYEALKLRI